MSNKNTFFFRCDEEKGKKSLGKSLIRHDENAMTYKRRENCECQTSQCVSSDQSFNARVALKLRLLRRSHEVPGYKSVFFSLHLFK